MSKTTPLFFRYCPFCEQGHVRLASCNSCEGLVALCDECELIWSEPGAIAADDAPSDSAHPRCPFCEQQVTWNFLNRTAIVEAGYEDLLDEASR